MRDRVDTAVKALRHPLRVVLVLLAVLSVVGPLVEALGAAAALLGAAIGLVLGEALGRAKKLRAAFVAGALVAPLVAGPLVAKVLVGVAPVARLVGPGVAMGGRTLVVLGCTTLGLVAVLRFVAVRRPTWRYVEVGAASAAFVAAFAAHREGSIARPLWLSDWAWRAGYDPSNLLILFAATFGVLAAAAVVMESKQRLSAVTLLSLPLLAAIVVAVVDPRSLHQPDPALELEAIQQALEPGQLRDAGAGEIPITYGHGDEGHSNGPGPLHDPNGEPGDGVVEHDPGDPGDAPGDPGDGTEPTTVPGDGDADGAEPGEGPRGGVEPGGTRPQGGDQPGGDQPQGGDEPGGEQPQGGDQPGGEQPQGGDQPGGEQPQGGDQPGGEQPQGGDQPGGEQPQGGDQPGGEQPQGGDQPGGEQPQGGDQPGGEPPPGGEDPQGSGEPGEPQNGEPADEPQDPMELQDANPDAQGEGSDALTRANQPRMSFDGERREGRGASVAAVVVFSDDYHTPSGYYYFRQQAHSELIGARLVPTTRDDADLDVEKEYPTEITPVREPPPWGERRRVRARVALLGEHDGPIALESPALFLPSENPDPDLFHTAYRFESYAQEIPYEELVGRTAGDPDWSEELRAYYLQTPDDPRYAALVEEVLATLPDAARQDPFTRALALKVHLDETMTYSLAARYPSATDPTAAFLFGDRIGYCVHSAHAAVYLWRLAGVPARVGTGYLVDETAREGAALTIMGSDAHAWPEMYLDGLGWIPVDVTPANTMDQPGQPPDGDLTRALGEIVRRASNEPEEEQERLPLGLWLRRILIGWAIAAVVSVFAAHHVVKGYRRLRPLLARPKAVPRVAYRAVLDQLTEAGLGREEGESREAHARRIEAIVPSFATLTAMHVAAKYGNPNTPLDRRPEFDVARWREARIAFRRELSAHTPGWRRLFGLVDPTTLYRTR